MKKLTATLVALFALSAVEIASAQSSVAVFGVIDASIEQYRGDGNGKVLKLGNSGNLASRLGFRGVEDLGGGLSASFWLEAAFAPDDGSGAATNTNNQPSGGGPAGGLTFNRRSTISLSGNLGEIRLGRDFAASFLNLAFFDPFGAVGIASSFNLSGALGRAQAYPTVIRASNAISYLLPKSLGGVYGQAMFALGENSSNSGPTSKDGRYQAARLGFAQHGLDVAAGFGRTEFAAGDYVQANLVGSYKFPVVTLMAQRNFEEIRKAFVARADSWLVGATVPVGAGEIRGTYMVVNQNASAGDNDATMVALGYVHNLSKRTAVYGTYAQIDNRGQSVLYQNGLATQVPGGKSTGLQAGLRHAF